jgi:hypothetical protein
VPNLQKRFGALGTALILGPLWALWHLPAFFVPGQIFDQKVGSDHHDQTDGTNDHCGNTDQHSYDLDLQ